MSVSDISSSLLELENEIQETVQQLKDDLKDNEELYDISIDDFNDNINIDNSNNANNESIAIPVPNQTTVGAPNSIDSNTSIISNRSDKRAMFKAFLLSKSDLKTDKSTINTTTIKEDEQYNEIPSQFQKLLKDLNNEINDNINAINNNNDEINASNNKQTAKPKEFQQLMDELSNNDEDEIIDDGNSDTQQELSQLLQDMEISQKEFHNQLKTKSCSNITHIGNTHDTETNVVLYQPQQRQTRISKSLDSSPINEYKTYIESPIHTRSVTFGSPKNRNTAKKYQHNNCKQYEFGRGRELVWEKQIKDKLQNRDPENVDLDNYKICSPRQYKRIKLLVDDAKNPTECTFQPQINRQMPMGSFFQRQQQWLHTANKKLKYQEIKKKLAQESECTFIPKINENKIDFCNVYNFEQINIANANGISLKKKRLIQQIKDKQHREFTQHCTFKPKLCKYSKKIAMKLKKNPKFKERYHNAYTLKVDKDADEHDEEMKECTFKPEINEYKRINLDHVRNYLKSDAKDRLSTTGALKLPSKNIKNKNKNIDKSFAINQDEKTKDFFIRLEIDQEIRKHHQRKLKKQSNPKFIPEINQKSLQLVNKAGVKFEQRQTLHLENINNTLLKHQLMKLKDIELNESQQQFKYKPELNAKSVSMVENKRVPRNGAGFSRANYYYYINQNVQIDANNNKYENKKLLNNPNLKEYFSLDVVERLNGNVRNKKEMKTYDHGNNDDNNNNNKKLSEHDFEDFIERQRKHEQCRQKRIQKLWKRFKKDDELETDKENTNINVSPSIKSQIGKGSNKSVRNINKPNAEDMKLSYTQLFNCKQDNELSIAQNEKIKKTNSTSYCSLSKMHCDTQFISM